MKLTEREKKLLRQQAEAYAFIKDLRDTAIFVGDMMVVKRTEGIEAKIERRRKEYPVAFQRYFNAAFTRGRLERLKATRENKNGEGKEISGRQEEPQEKVVEEKKSRQKPKSKKRQSRKPGVRRSKPE